MSSLLGARVCIDKICRGCELEISRIQLTLDLRVMDMSKFDVIIGMGWLAVHRVVINCDQKRIIAYISEGAYFKFQREKYNALPAIYDSRCHCSCWVSLRALHLRTRQDRSCVYLK